MKKSLSLAALVCVAGTATVADAAPVAATLVSVTSHTVNGSGTWNGTLDTSAWTFDVATGTAAQTGGTYSRLIKAGVSPLMRHTMTGVTLGSGAATGATWACIEGTFGGGGTNTGGVGASICGNYNFGTNFINQSTYTPTVVGATVAYGGDDGVIGPPETLVNQYSGMSSINVGGGLYMLSNGVPPGSSLSTTGYDFLFQVIAAAVDDGPIELPEGVATVIPVGANDTGFTDPVTLSITSPPSKGVINTFSSPGPAAGQTITYTANIGAHLGDTIVYQITDSKPGTPNTDLATVSIDIRDRTPSPFDLVPKNQQPANTIVESLPITPNGYTDDAQISVSGGQYSINAGPYTSAIGNISPADNVKVRHTTGMTSGARVNTELTIGGVTGLFFTTVQLADLVVVESTNVAANNAAPVNNLLDVPGTEQKVGVESEGVVSGGDFAAGFCSAPDIRQGPPSFTGAYTPRPLRLSELASYCPSLTGESLVIAAYIRPIPDKDGNRRFLFTTVTSTAEVEGMMLSQGGYNAAIIEYLGGLNPPCNAATDDRPLWIWGLRKGEDVEGVLTDENQVMKPVSIQCNAPRGGTKTGSNFVQNVSLDGNLYSSASYLAGQNNDMDTILNKLDADDNSCNATLQAQTGFMKAQAAICRTATVFPVVTRDTAVAPVRLTRSVYRYAMKVKLRNYGGAVTSGQVIIRSGVPATVVTGGVVTKTFGAIAAGVLLGYVETTEQSFTIEQDRLLPVDVGVLLPAVTFVPLSGTEASRYQNAILGCEEVAVLAKALATKTAFNSCPAPVKAKKYRGALIGAGLTAAFTIYDRLARPSGGPTPWSIYPLRTDIVEGGQIPGD